MQTAEQILNAELEEYHKEGKKKTVKKFVASADVTMEKAANKNSKAGKMSETA